MKLNQPLEQHRSPWPHRLAVALVCVTFPLIWVGGLVTTYQAGMAVPDWPNTYGYNLFLYPPSTWIAGPWDLFIEHGHRLLGALAGVVAIALAVSIWRSERRVWVRRLGWLTLLAVIAQGVLGGLRVLLVERQLALIHGCFGPAFFSLTVALACVTSRDWQSQRARRRHAAAGRLQRLALLTAGVAYVQLVLGALLRHLPPTSGRAEFRIVVLFHLFVALLLVMHVLLLAWHARKEFSELARLRRPATAAAILVLAQVVLGCAVWVVNYGWPAWFRGIAWADQYVVTAEGVLQTTLTTAHVALGSLILVISVLVCLRTFRYTQAIPKPAGMRHLLLEIAG